MSWSIVVLAALVVAAQAFTFDLEARKYRCFTEELPTGLEVAALYAAAPGYAQYIDFKVTDPMNKIIFEEIGTDRGSFKQTISVGGDYAFCFYSRMVSGVRYAEGMKRTVSFDLKTGSETHDYAALATKEHLKPLEVSLRVMEDVVRTIHSEYAYFKEREVALRETNEHTNARAMWATIITMGIILGFSVWQIRHLKKYFRRKRMID